MNIVKPTSNHTVFMVDFGAEKNNTINNEDLKMEKNHGRLYNQVVRVDR